MIMSSHATRQTLFIIIKTLTESDILFLLCWRSYRDADLVPGGLVLVQKVVMTDGWSEEAYYSLSRNSANL